MKQPFRGKIDINNASLDKTNNTAMTGTVEMKGSVGSQGITKTFSSLANIPKHKK